MRHRKIFAGAKLRTLREQHNLTQGQLAVRLEVSTSYINQIENNQRPLTASLMLGLAEKFNLDLGDLMSDKSDRILADLREALADPVFGETVPGLLEIKSITANYPAFAHALLRLYGAYRKTSERLSGFDAAITSSASQGMPSAYEEVRDFFHYSDNYIDPLDRAGETLAQELDGPGHDYRQKTNRLDRLSDYLERTHDASIKYEQPSRPDMLRAFDRASRILYLNAHLDPASWFFQIASQLALMEQTTQIANIIEAANFKTDEARQICRIGLANYFAGALLLPYGAFARAAEKQNYDLEELARQFGASLEQVAHRLSTMQRPGQRGVPFFFARIDAAGTITKRHSATPLQFARFGGACPLWNVHRAFEAHGAIIRQLAQTPDNNRYLCLAWSSEKRLGGFNSPTRRYAYALGCEISHAAKLVYAFDLNLDNEAKFDPIGVSCRTCERRNCLQRSLPPIAAAIAITPNERAIVPYKIV
ncbi:Propionyl-CoA carboxylase regulator [hydrothermal vent metagenome]|uniref:Propionyl-CoA carboxylase regulator n=1 Tax=hydrothermal vent metagenome TaxID=652676 RepID=A0A3B0UTL1_9ZZZZ